MCPHSPQTCSSETWSGTSMHTVMDRLQIKGMVAILWACAIPPLHHSHWHNVGGVGLGANWRKLENPLKWIACVNFTSEVYAWEGMRMHVQMHTHTCASAYTHTHACRHTHTHTHTHTLAAPRQSKTGLFGRVEWVKSGWCGCVRPCSRWLSSGSLPHCV